MLRTPVFFSSFFMIQSVWVTMHTRPSHGVVWS